MDSYDDNLISMSEAEWQEAVASRLADLGLANWEQLRDRARVNPTTAEQRLWILLGGERYKPEHCGGTVVTERQFDELTSTLHLPDPAPVLAAAAGRRRRYVRH